MALRLEADPDEMIGEPDDGTAPLDAGDDDLVPDAEERDGLEPLRGLAIAAAAFVPTFVAVFFGLTHLLGSATPPRPPGDPAAVAAGPIMMEPAPPATPSVAGPSSSEDPALGSGPAVALPVPEGATPGERGAARDDRGARTPAEPSPAEVEPSATAAPAPALPFAAPHVSEPSRRAAAAPPTTARSSPASRSASPEWTPAAAFGDREAAGRLASSIERQGYPVEIRRDGSAARPWVVWIATHPTGGARSR
jgi:hypothetical protein